MSSLRRISLILSALGMLLLSACSSAIPSSPVDSPTVSTPPSATAALESTASAFPSPTVVTVEPTATLPFRSPGLATVGPVEVVFDWTKDRCEPYDIPDLPARAFRDAQGMVHLISAHLAGRSFNGPSLNEVKRDCEVIMQSDHDGDPSKYDDNEWIAATYTEDGNTIYAVIDNEFHGWEHGMCSGNDNFACWYNALTMAVSTDGGHSFAHAAEPPAHLLASLPYQYEDGAGPYGVMEPGSLIRKDGFYYLFVRIDGYRSDSQKLCLLRTDNLAQPASWRAWDGHDFSVVMHSPYDASTSTDSLRQCTAIDPDLGLVASSITYNTYLHEYVMLGLSTDNFSTNREIWGVMYAFSRDLINWDRRVLLFEAPLMWSRQAGNPRVYHYPSLIDPDSTSLSFETTGKTAYLYLTRFNGGDPLDRDLIRIPVEFFPSRDEAAAAEVPFVP